MQVLLRLSGEVSTKARETRWRFVSQLLRNLRDALRSEGIAYTLVRKHDRIFVELADARGAEVLARLFGVQSVSVAIRGPGKSLEEIVARGEQVFAEKVRNKRFAVRARLVGKPKDLGFSSRDLLIQLGAKLGAHALRVDLDTPEVTASVEVHEGHAYFFSESFGGEGGLPLGTEGRALALVSGGFDSAVAAWQMMRRGLALELAFFNLGGRSHRAGTQRVMHALATRWAYGTHPRLHCVDFDAVSRDLQEKTEPRYWQVILKRLMLRAADALARELACPALVTGEALGQVSSQTLVNLATISAATQLPILRPLVGANKDEIIDLAHRIGTGPISATVAEYCALVPRRPATAATLAAVEAEEAKLDATLLARAVATREIVDVRDADPEASALPELAVEAIPPGAVVIDLRSRDEFKQWSLAGSVQLDFARALEALHAFSGEQRYVAVCAFGLKSAHLAELMRKQGLDAYHFRGGTAALKNWAERATP
ncbi:MAG: tRNA 4-thiouridine(8) synthase ThiI [Deltaproteobacteria bacterium]|nr:tRNA 4-thiouridine(8) synthase ThiI [Deltaproteobacteria bacterium]